MPIRIICHDKPYDRVQPTEDKRLSAPLGNDSMACYADREIRRSILCGAI